MFEYHLIRHNECHFLQRPHLIATSTGWRAAAFTLTRIICRLEEGNTRGDQ